MTSEKGEFGVKVDWDWRVEDRTKILFGSSNHRKETQNGLMCLKGAHITSIEALGIIPEIKITLSNACILKSMSMHDGNPKWGIRINDRNYLWWDNGYFFFGSGEENIIDAELKSLDRSIETVKRWNLPVLDEKENNCGCCEYYNGIEGDGPLLDHGVCTYDSSERDGCVVNFRFGCKFFASTK